MPLDEINLYFDPDELVATPTNPQFDAKEWRGQGRLYKDLPRYVALELEHTRLVPSALMQMTMALTTVQKKGSANVNILNIEEDDGVDK